MADYTSKVITDKNIWEGFVLSKKPKSFLQSWNWGEVNDKMGAKIFRLGLYSGKKLSGVCLLILEKAKRGRHLIVPGGPVLDWGDSELVNFFVNQIKTIAHDENAWFVRIRPEILDTPENRSRFKKLGFLPAPMHLHAENTWILDISKPEAELLSGMRKTTRYLVKRGDTYGLACEESEDLSYAKILFRLQKETMERHGFVGFPERLFRTEVETFSNDNQGKVFVCKKGGKILAAAIIIFYGDSAYYHFSGSVSGYSKIPFSYFLQWQIIKSAKKRGLKFYNFWGIAPVNEPHHRFAGVTVFKTGFGGERIDWLHAHDLPVSKLYWITFAFETLRKIFRRL